MDKNCYYVVYINDWDQYVNWFTTSLYKEKRLSFMTPQKQK